MSDSNNILTNGDFEATTAGDATGAVDHGTWFTAEAIDGWQATEGLIEIQDASSGGRGTPVDETGILASGSVLELDSYDYQSRCWRADGREADSTVSQSFTLEEASSFALGFSYAANCSTRTSDFSVTITDEDGNVVFFQEFSAREGNLEVAWQRFEADLDLDAGTYSLSFSSAQYEDRDTVGALIDNVSLVDTAPQAENDSYTLDLGESEVLDVTAVMGTETESVTVLDEDFSGTRHLKRLDTVASSDLAAVDGKAFSNACADGVLLFEPVDMSGLEAGTLSFVIDSDPTCWASFEAAGSRFGDYIRVEISVDGGEFILLDLFSVPVSEEGLAGRQQTFVGSLTGQTFSSDGATLSYALPEGAGSVQLRFVTDFSQFGEIVTFDDVLIQGEQTVETGYESGLLANDTDGNGEALEIVSAEGVDLFGSVDQEVTVFEENFDDAKRNLEKLDTVEDSDLHGVDGVARTTNRSGGELEFAEVDITGLDNETFSFSLNADLLGCQRFESYGWARDFVEVQVRFDDGSYQTIDVFDVEWRGGQQVFVGRESGQEVAVSDGFVALSYDLAALAGDAETAQIRLIAEATSHGEIFEVDDVSLAGTFTQRTGDGIATITLDSGAIVTIKSDGSFSYNANGQFAYLAEGEETTDTFSYTVQDASGNTDTATVTINLVGTNEDPVIGLADVSGAVTEIADGAAGENTTLLSDSGTIAFTDVDLIDTHSVTVTPVSATDSLLGSVAARGTLSAVVSDAATGDGAGEITWTFEVADSALDDLAEGEVITQVYTVTVDDGQGGTASKTVTISLTGTNDAPVITTATGGNEGAVVEAGNLDDGTSVSGVPAATGVLTSADVDTGATAIWSGDAAGTYGAFAIDPATGAWTYTLDNADGDTDALAEGEVVTETFTATVTDDFGATATQVVTVTITGTNDSPVITTATGGNEGAVVEAGDAGVPGTPVATGTLTSSDVDTGAIAIWSGDAAGTYGAFAIDPATGAWTYTLDNADGDTDALAEGEVVTETFTATVTDDFGATATQVVTVTITGTNDSPVITTATGGNEGAVVEAGDTGVPGTPVATGTLTSSDVDTGATATWSGDTAGTYGAFAIDPATGAWTYTLDNVSSDELAAGETVTESFTATVTDDFGAMATQVVTVTITGTNDSPVITTATGANEGALVEAGDTGVPGTPVATGTLTSFDVDTGATATWSGDAAGTYGAFAIDPATGAWTYTLDNADGDTDALAAGEVVTETFTATVTDDFGATATQVVTVTITGTNDSPVITTATGANEGAVTEAGDAGVPGTPVATGTLTSSDVDTGATATWSGDTAGTFGAFAIDPATGVWTYTLDNVSGDELAAGETVTETFTATVTDDFGATATQVVTVTITGTNDSPVITTATGGNEGAVVEAGDAGVPGTPVATGTLTSSDVDTGATGTWSGDAAGTFGGFAIDPATGAWTYTLDNVSSDELAAGETVTETFTATVTDDFGATATQVVTVTVTGTNDSPVITSATGQNEGAVVEAGDAGVPGTPVATGTLTSSDVDTGATATWSGDAAGTFGAFAIDPATGVWTYTLDNVSSDELAAGETVTEAFTATVTDDFGASATQVVTVTVTGTNDSPVITTATGANEGAVVEAGDTGVPGTPVATGTLTSSDVDTGATATWSGDAAGTYGAFAIDPATGAWTYTLDNADGDTDALAEGEVVAESFTATVTDDFGATATQVVTVTITGTNDSPVITTATGGNEGVVVEAGDAGVPGTPVATGTLTSSDVDTGATATWSGDAAGTFGAFAIDPATGAWTYTLDNVSGDELAAGETVTETFTATVTDDFGATATQVVSVTITGTNDSPVITTATGGNEGVVVEAGDAGVPGTPVATGTLTSSDVDTGATATWSGDAAGTYGALAIDPATGVWTYTLDNVSGDELAAGETVSETFTATVTDDFGATAAQLVTIIITGTNDVPVIDAAASDLTGTVVEDSAETLSDTGTISFSDVDTTDIQSASRALVSVTGDLGPITAAQALTFLNLIGLSTSASAQDGSVDWAFSADNALFDHLGCDEELVFTYEIAVSDAEGADTVQVSVTVTGTNDLPRVSGNVDGGTTHEDASPVTVDLLANASDAEGDDLGVANVTVTSSDGRTVAVQSVDASTGEISIDPSQFNDLAAGEQATLTIAYDVIEEDRTYDDTTAGEALDNAGTFFIADNDTGSIIRIKRSSAIVTHQQAINAAGVADGSVVLVDDNSRGLGVSAGTVVDGVFAIGDASAIQSMTNFTGTVGLDPNNVPPTYAFYEGTLADSTLTIAMPRDGGDCGDATHTFIFTGFDQAAPGIQPAFDALAVNVSPEPVPATATLVIEGRNDGPVAVNDDNAADALVEQGFGVAGDDTASGNVIANDSDDDQSDVLSVTRVNSGTGEPGSVMAVDATTVQIVLGRYGSLAIQADGSWDYTLNNLDPDTEALADGDTAFEVFTYTVSDGNGGEDTATLTLEISGSGDNVAPVANDDSFAVAEDTPATLDLLGNDTDGNNVPVVTQTLSVVSINGQAATAGATIATNHGTITIGAGGVITYVPDLNYNGTDSFTYVASDGLEDSGAATVTLDVTAVNDAPTAVDDSFSGDEDTAITGNVLANDSDVEGDGLAVTAGTFATSDGGSVTIAANGDFTYSPAPDFSGAATFDYTVSDGNGGASTGSVTLNVNAVADAPVIGVPGGSGELQAEQRSNSYTLSTQYFSEVTTLANGGHVVTWASSGQDGSATGIYAQRYAADGSAIGSEFRVNTYTTGTQLYASTTDLGDGGFVIVWTSDGPDGSGYGVVGQRYDSDGNPAGSEFLVNTYTNSTQYLPNVASLADGGFVVNWNSYSQDGSSYGIFAQRYDVNGDPVGTEFKVNTFTSGSQFNDGHIDKNIAGLADGGFVVCWYDGNGRDGSGYAVFAQQYDADGNAVGGEFQVNTYTTHNQLYANVAALTDGGYVITWTSYGQDGSGYGIYGQRYDASGSAVGSEFQVNTTTSSTQYFGGVTGLASGGFVVVWDSRVADGSGYGVVAQEFDAAGNKVGGEILINSTTANDQRYSSVDARPDGGYVVTWSDNSNDGSGWGVFVRAAAGSGASGDEDTGIALDISAALTDTDGSETLSDITISGVPDGAVLSAGTDNNDGTWTLTQAQLSGLTLQAAENWNGSFDLTVTVTSTESSNGDTATSTETFTVTINPVNDDPVANGDGAIAAQEDVPLTISAADLLANDTDVDIATNGQSLSIASVSNAVNGSVSLDVNGDVVFTPDANFYGEASFDYTVSDGNGGSSTATATIDVAPVNDAPVIDLGGSDLTEEVTAGFRLSGSFDANDFLAAFDNSRGTASVVTVNGLEALRVQVNAESQRNPHTFMEIVEAGVLESDDKISLTVEGQVTRTGGDQDIFFGLTDGTGQVSYFSVNGAAGRLYVGDLETDAQPGDSVQNGSITSNAVNLSGGQNNSFRLEIVLDGENDTISIFRSNGALVGTFDGYSAAGDPADQTNALDPSLGLKLFLASDNTTETNYFVGLDYEMEITRSGTVAFDDIDVTDTHSASVASVTVTGDNGLLNLADAFDFLDLEAVDQSADTVDWNFDLSDPALADVLEGLGAGESLIFDYQIQITDAAGATDTESLRITLNGDDFFA